MKFRSLALAALLVVCGAASADNAPAPVVIEDVAKFLDFQRDLRDDVKTSKFKHMDESSKDKLFAAQNTVFALLKGKRSVDELNPAQQVELFNAQTLIAGIVTDAELDRPVCKREKRVGSNRATTVCTTKRQMEEHRNELQRNMRAPRNCMGAECLSTR